MNRVNRPVAYLSGAPEGRESLMHGPINRYSLLIPLCVLGIVVANAYSLMITNNGLLISNTFPDLRVFNAEIPQTYATFLFAGVLQFGILVLYLLLAVSPPLGKLVVAPFLIILAGVSFYFGFLSVHANARGDAYLGSVGKRIDHLSAAITGENRYIATSVNEALAGSLRLAEASKRGQDKTGVAVCGPLCQGHYERAQAIEGRYRHLLTAPLEPAQSPDVRTQWREASALFSAYVGRSRDYDRFLKERDSTSGYAVSPEVAEAHDTLQGLFSKGMDDRWMLTAQSLRDIARDPGVAVSALISIMPDVINLSFSITISALLVLSRRGVMNRRVARAPLAAPGALVRDDPAMGNLPLVARGAGPVLGEAIRLEPDRS